MTCARRLESLLPKQSARLQLVNDVNFMLYTPFLPEAAAGLLEPRHVVTPLRDVLDRTYLRLGAICGHDPAARTVTLRTHDGAERGASLRPARDRRSARSRGHCRCRDWTSTRSGSRASPTRSGCATTWSSRWRWPTAARTLSSCERLLTFVFVGGGYAGLEALAELQDFAADAMDRYPRARLHGMRWILVEATDRVLPEIDSKLADYALAELRGRGIEIRLGTTLDEVDRRRATLSTGETVPTRTVVWTAGVIPHPSLRAAVAAAGRWRAGAGGRAPARCRGRTASGRSATAPRSPSRAAASRLRPRSTASGRRAGRRQRRGGAAGRARRAATATRAAPRSSTSAATRPWGGSADAPSRGFLAWWMARTYHLSQIPGTVPQGPRRDRLDRQPALRPRHLRGRLDRAPAPAARPRSTRPAAATARWRSPATRAVVEAEDQ